MTETRRHGPVLIELDDTAPQAASGSSNPADAAPIEDHASALLARVTTFTTIAGAEAAVEGMKYMASLDVISVQDMHAQIVA